MKTDKKRQAIELRKQGMSVNNIAQELNVAKSSVSIWVKDISLTDLQINNLRNRSSNTHLRDYSILRKNKAREARIEYQESGKLKAKEKNILHCMGCMLYWAEGSKGKNSIEFTNMDVDMQKLFIRFLREEFSVPEEKFTVYINCFINKLEDWELIKNYWIKELKLSESSLRKPSLKIINEQIENMGVCRLVVNDTKLVQHIYGAIQEYAGFDTNYCLNGRG